MNGEEKEMEKYKKPGKDLLSVIVPIYNSERCLERCIKSLLSQTYINIEIILINDGSKDGSGKVCDVYAEKYKNIRVFHQENFGVNEARKEGVLHAQGNYVTFVDSDDWTEPELFEILMSELLEADADMVAAGVTVDDVKGNSKILTSAIESGVYTKEDIETYIFPRMVYDDIRRRPGIFAYLVGKVLKRETLLESISDLDSRLTYGEDGAVVFPFLAEINKLVVADYSGYHYVQCDTSVTHNLDLEMFRKISYLEKYLITKFKKLEKYELVETQVHYFVRDLLMNVMKAEYDVDCGKILCVPPYELIPKNSRLVIYGAGKAGKEFVRLLLQNHYAEIVAWVDQDFGREIYSYKIEKPESIQKKEYDYVLIALTDENIVGEVTEFLQGIHVNEDKIIWKEINWG